MTTADSRSGAQAIERAMAVLDCFVARPEITLSEVAGITGIPVGTTHRIMQALLRGGYLTRLPGGSYQVGGHVAALVPRPSVAEEVSPYLYLLAAGVKLTVSFGVMDNVQLATLVRARPPVRHCSAQIPADRGPLHATAMGKALLAFDAAGPGPASRTLGALTSYTSRTRTARADLLADLDRTRRVGFAESDGERTEGVREIAVPVFVAGHQMAGAIGIQARCQRLTDEKVAELVPHMRSFAERVGRHLTDVPAATA